MNASLREIVLAVRFGEASLVGESVGYLVLGACDRAVAVPRAVDLDGVLVTSEGEVVLDANPASEDEAERSLRYLLAQLLTLLRSPFPNLARVAERAPCGLRHLVTELEAALVPVNRRAARRSLSRLVREARRSQAEERREVAVVDIEPRADRDAVTAPPAPESPSQAFEEHTTGRGSGWEEVDEVPSLLFEPVTTVLAPTVPALPLPEPDVSDLAFSASTLPEASPQVEAPLAPFDDAPEQVLAEAIDDAFDQALTRVASAVETLPPPETRPRTSFNLRRLAPAVEVEGPLVPTLAPSAVRPSSIEDLLLRMRIDGEPADVVLAGLAQLARVDVSPAAPPVG